MYGTSLIFMTSEIIFTSCVTQEENVCVHQFNRMHFNVFDNVLLETSNWSNFHYFEPEQNRQWGPIAPPPPQMFFKL